VAAAGQRTRSYKFDPDVRRRVDLTPSGTTPQRGLLEANRIRPSSPRLLRRKSPLRNAIEERLFLISAISLAVGAVGWGLLFYNEYRSLFSEPAPVATLVPASAVNARFASADMFATSSYARVDPPHPIVQMKAMDGGEDASIIVAREWSLFQPMREIDRGAAPAKAAKLAPPVRVATLGSVPPQTIPAQPAPVVSRIPSSATARTSLADFVTAPFPYHGNMPGSDRPFLNAGEQGNRGHVNFRGSILWEAQTFADDRVLLHIPPGFDPKRPAVMVVFFHGHGAELERDVRDRQRLPDQITAAGANAVLVAPQFAFDAADSSAGKFWQPNGFKRFLDEAAQKLARLYGDPRSERTFATMPIVIVAYSGGFGPTLAVLDHGGANSRVRGLVLLDALYAGIDQFADWIADNRSAFFVSSYTPHTAHHNADLERALRERSVSYGAELRRNHLQGMVAFLPTGDIPHRDFVTHAWADNPVEDILARLDDIDPKIETASTAAKRN